MTSSVPTDHPAPARSPRAEQILDAAERLIVKQGFKGVTMATVAARAHVGKGTAYLYWRTKEDLFLELVAREMSGLQADLARQVRDHPSLARPEELCPALLSAAIARPLVRAVQTSDDDVLGGLLNDPRTRDLLAAHGAEAMLSQLLPVWRSAGLARTDWSVEDQVASVGLLAMGWFTVEARRTTALPGIGSPPGSSDLSQAELDHTARLTIDALVSPRGQGDEDSAPDLPSLAEAVSGVLEGLAEKSLTAIG